jgi:acetylglutamate kinase
MQRGTSAPVVLKFGGELLEEPERVTALARTIAKLDRVMPLVIVHGGGREIDAALARAGIEKRQVDGLRITDEPTLDIVVGVLAGLVNTRIVAALVSAGVPAVGLTGADAGIGRVEPAARHRSTAGASVDLGRVGEPVGREKPALLADLCAKGYVPVISSIGASEDGRLFNVNADTLAANLGARLKSPRLVVAGGTAGVYDKAGGTIPGLSVNELDELIRDGSATAGMIAKLTACRGAVEGGVREVFIADGRNLDGLSALIRHGQKAGSGQCTRIVRSGFGRKGRGGPRRSASVKAHDRAARRKVS